MAPRDPHRRHSVEHPPRPVPKRDTDVDLLERPSREREFDEPARERDGGFDPAVNSVPR